MKIKKKSVNGEKEWKCKSDAGKVEKKRKRREGDVKVTREKVSHSQQEPSDGRVTDE